MANKRIKDLGNEASSSTLDENQYAVVDGSTGTFKTKLSALSDWIHGRLAAFVNALTAKTSFAFGDKIAVVNGSTATAMSKDDLLKETAQSALAGNEAPAFDESGTTTYKAGEPVVMGGKIYVFNVDHTGAWDAAHVDQVTEQVLNRNIGGLLCRVIGNGDTPVLYKIFAREGSVLRVTPRQTTWDVTGVISTHIKLAIRRRTSAGAYVDMAVVNLSDDAPSVIDAEIPTGTAWVEIFARAAVGTELLFDVYSYTSVQPKSYPNTSYFEMGNITMSPSSLSYSSITTRARTKQNVLVKVKKGDIVGVEAGFQMYVSFTTTGTSPYTVKGWTTSYTFAEDGYAALLFRKGIGSDSPTTFDELMNAIYVRSFNSELNAIPYILSVLIPPVETFGTTIKKQLDGANDSAKVWRFLPPKNTTVRVIPSKISWNTSNIGGDAKAKLSIRKVLADNSFADVVIFYRTEDVPSVIDVPVPDDAVYMEIFFRADAGDSVTFEVNSIEQRGLMVQQRNALFKSVNHRGFNTVAPENTLPAFRLSAKMGFGIVETDVHVTSDNVFVCIHDSTVDRTSDGSGNVADMTLAQLRALDFGSWKSADYAGTKIPTYEEFLVCCRNLGLSVYVELKAIGDYTELINITKRLGMYEHTTFISDSISKLQVLNARDDSLRIAYVVTEINATVISSAQGLRTGKNKVFLDVRNSNLTDAMIALAENDDFPVEVWTVNSHQAILSLNPYVSGVTSDSLIASNFIYGAELAK
ncbi:MAG: hypothetical protein J6T54_12370 [Fibrobacter sp.]|nr:hypothetical protein [Fibrobacter sp.]